MARKKPTRSRAAEFKSKQRKSWVRFLTKISLFVFPIVVGTAWLIWFIVPSGQTLPIMVLDFQSSSDQRGTSQVWNKVNFEMDSESSEIEISLPPGTELQAGGPKKDVVVVYSDLLGSARLMDGEESPVACIFKPSNAEEHLTHAYRGLLHDETAAEEKQWMRFDDYLKTVVEAVNQKSTLKTAARGKIIIVLDIDHPDLPARLPPQSNEFIALCKQQWESASVQLNDQYDVCVWLSHSEGQKSYYDSSFESVESIFKRRFELGITGDVLNLNNRKSSQGDVFYSDLKNYLLQWVQSDSNVHKLAQTPTFLEAGDLEDFPMLRLKNSDKNSAKIGTLFDYTVRKDFAEFDGLNQLWEDYRSVKQSAGWTLENPLLAQRATMILLQLEKIWFVGQAESKLYKDLRGELQSILETKATISLVKHSARDGMAAANRKKFDKFDLNNWLPNVAQPKPGEELSSEAKAAEIKRKKSVVEWQNKNSTWTGALGVWVAIRDANEEGFDRAMIVGALGQLTDRQRIVDRADTAEGLSKIYWNEIGYLERLASELQWPADKNDLKEFRELVQLTIINRDLANEFAAKMAPSLTLEFSKKFGEFENDRRFFEDRLFANDFVKGQTSLRSEMRGLRKRYVDLGQRHDDLKREFERLQSALIAAPHDLRYCLESLAVQTLHGTDVEKRKSLMSDFQKWSTGEDGFQKSWNSLCARQTLEAVLKRADDRSIDQGKYTTEFEQVRLGGFAADGYVEGDTKGLASNPYQDYSVFNRLIAGTGQETSKAMEVADGNLLARRLLLWPGLALDIRKKVRSGLSSMEVRASGRVGEEETNVEFDFDNSEIAGPLGEVLRDQPMDLLTPSSATIAYTARNADFFSNVAFAAHRLLIKRSKDQTTENVLIAINDFRSEKSNLEFQRVANDLWATPKTSTDNFVNSSLRNHLSLTNVRVQNIGGRMETREKLRANWEKVSKPSWQNRIDEVVSFSEGFATWNWKQKLQKAINNDITPTVKTLQKTGNDFMFALSPEQRSFATIFRGEFNTDDNWLDHRKVSGNHLRIYLRGHDFDVGVVQRSADPTSVAFEIDMENKNLSGAKLIVKRAKLGPISGHITLVIDCSGSMAKDSRMESAKRDVIQFLERISKRGDISVSLVSIGLFETWNFDKQDWDFNNKSKFPSWVQVEKGTLATSPKSNDVFVYEGRDKIVNKTTLPDLKKAVGELRAFGETPILAGLNKALSMSGGGEGRPNLIVLLTDGFEFGNRGVNAGEKYAVFDESLRQRIKQKKNEVGGELVVFNYLSSSLKAHFGKSFVDDVTESVIRDRIEKIESLATINVKASRMSTLSAFLSGLLPQPVVFFKGEGMQTIKRRVKVGLDERDAGKSEAEQRIMSIIGLGSKDRPNTWSTGIEFLQSEMGAAARSFAKPPSEWSSSTRLAGNELLEFHYDPFSPSFELATSAIQQPKQVEVSTPAGSMILQVGETKQRDRKPEFELASKDGNVLTPAPAIAFVTFSQSGAPNETVLLQDLNFKQQVRSNVHPLEFGEFRNDHRRAMFKQGKPIDMRLFLVPSFPAQFWSKVMFDDEDVWSMTSASRKQNINRSDYVSLADYLPKSKPFSDYSISIRRDNNQTETAEYWIKIESKENDTPMDRWLIQVLNKDGEIERLVNKNSLRKYEFREQADGSRELEYIEHRFRIVKDDLMGAKAFFGFAHLDDVAADAAKVDYPNHIDGN